MEGHECLPALACTWLEHATGRRIMQSKCSSICPLLRTFGSFTLFEFAKLSHGPLPAVPISHKPAIALRLRQCRPRPISPPEAQQ